MGVILIAFERESEQSALDQLLSSQGHRVIRAGNGLTALDTARREPPDLIVSDIVLPRMDGFALCRKWKQDERLQATPFIFYTRRHDDPKYERFALELGAERFFARSANNDALLSAVKELMSASGDTQRQIRPPAAADAAAPSRAQTETQTQLRIQQDAWTRELQQARTQTEALTQQLAQGQQTHAQLRAQVAELETSLERVNAGEARFRRLFDANPTPMWLVDRTADGFVALNDAALTLFGASRTDLLGMKVSALPLAPEGDHFVLERAGEERRTLTLARGELEFDGRAVEMICACDLTADVQAVQHWREQATQTRAVIDANPDGCLVLDGEGAILDVNAAYCRLLGYERDALLGREIKSLEDESVGENTLRWQLGRVRGGARYETKHRRADGAAVDVEVHVGLLESVPGGSIVVVRDMTQRRREQIAHRMAQRRSETLLELFQQAEELDEPALLRRALEVAAELTGSSLSFLYWVDAKAETAALAAWREQGASHESDDPAPQALSQASHIAVCVRNRHPIANNESSAKAQRDGLPALHRYVAAPLIDNGQVVAALGVANRSAPYGEEDQRALVAVADVVQRVMRSKQFRVHTMAALQRTDVALQSLIESFVRVSERHDPYTAGSARRVAALATALAREAGMDGAHQHAVRIAALLHDVGNIAVPASILSKPAPLTETELALMRTHVEEGCQLLAEVDFGAPVAEIVYQSHERFDGSGYPRGLKGEAIRPEARVLGVADCFEAMCSPRPYRPALSMDKALDELQRGAGRLYDPVLVEACTRLIRERGFRLPE